jgi:hypothetical protein
MSISGRRLRFGNSENKIPILYVIDLELRFNFWERTLSILFELTTLYLGCGLVCSKWTISVAEAYRRHFAVFVLDKCEQKI